MRPRRTRSTDMNSQTPFSRLRDAFRVYNQTTGKSPATIAWYDDKLDLFERYIAGRNVTDPVNNEATANGTVVTHPMNIGAAANRAVNAYGVTLADVTVANVRAYIADLQNRTRRYPGSPGRRGGNAFLSTSYVQGFARALRAFARGCTSTATRTRTS